MTKQEIAELINANEVIKDAYNEFKSKINGNYKIIDMYEMAHFNEWFDEAYILYEKFGDKKEYKYYKEYRQD